MSWWSGKKKEDTSSSSEFSDSGFLSSDGNDAYASAPSSGGYAPSTPSAGGGSDLQEAMVAMQQSEMVRSIVMKLSDMAFETCVTKPGTSLSSSEVNCVKASVYKYLDTNEFVVGRFMRSAKKGG